MRNRGREGDHGKQGGRVEQGTAQAHHSTTAAPTRRSKPAEHAATDGGHMTGGTARACRHEHSPCGLPGQP